MDQILRTVKRMHILTAGIIDFDHFFLLRLWFSGYAQDKDLVLHIQTLNGARKAAITANNQFLSTPVRQYHSLDFMGAHDG